MKKPVVYIASSWKNCHTVELLSKILDSRGFDVRSFVRNSFEENLHVGYEDFEAWIKSENGRKAFDYDIVNAMNCDLLIYISPSGNDAWAEVGACYASQKAAILGLGAKGEQVGLMRKLVHKWYNDVDSLLDEVSNLFDTKIRTAEDILLPYIERPFRHTVIVERDNAIKAMNEFASQFQNRFNGTNVGSKIENHLRDVNNGKSDTTIIS